MHLSDYIMISASCIDRDVAKPAGFDDLGSQ